MSMRVVLALAILCLVTHNRTICQEPSPCSPISIFDKSGLAEYMDYSSFGSPDPDEIRPVDPTYTKVPYLYNESLHHIKIVQFPAHTESDDLVRDFGNTISNILNWYTVNLPDNSQAVTVTLEFPSCWAYTDDQIYTVDDLTSGGYYPCDENLCCIMTFNFVPMEPANPWVPFRLSGKTLINSSSSCPLPLNPEEPCQNLCSVFNEINTHLDPLDHAPCFESCSNTSTIYQGSYGKQVEYSDNSNNTILLRPSYEVSQCSNGEYNISLFGLEVLNEIEGDFDFVDQSNLTQKLMEYAINTLTGIDNSNFTVNFFIPCLNKTADGYELCDPEECCEFTFDIQVSGNSNNRKKEIINVSSSCDAMTWSNKVPTIHDFALSTPITIGGWEFPQTDYIEAIDPATRDLSENSPGQLKGELTVTPTGSAVYSVPLFVAPGTNGMQPKLNLIYNSQAGNGLAGWGFDVDAVSTIKRVGKDRYHDNVNEKFQFTNFDKLSFDGERLIVVEGVEGLDGAIYQTQSDNAKKVYPMFSTPKGYQWFRVEYKDGKIVEYGRTQDSRQTLKNGVVAWYINKVTDANGNYVDYDYIDHNGQIVLSEIHYTGNTAEFLAPYATVKFNYTIRNDKNKHYYEGDLTVNELLIESIESNIDDNVIRKYEFKYIFEHFSKLHTLTEIGRHGARRNSLVFENYATIDQAAEAATEVAAHPISGLANEQYKYYVFGDYNGDGVKDRVTIERDYLPGENLARWHLQIGYPRKPDQTSDMYFTDPPGGPQTFVTDDYYRYNHELLREWIFSGDLNHDGYDDLIVPLYKENVDPNNQHYLFKKAHNYKKLFFRVYLSDGARFVFNSASEFWLNVGDYDSFYDQSTQFVVAGINYNDFDDDGELEICLFGSDRVIQNLSLKSQDDIKIVNIELMDGSNTVLPGQTIMANIKTYQTDIGSDHPMSLMGRFNSDNKTDLYIGDFDQQKQGYFFELKSNGFFGLINTLPTLSVGGPNANVGDFNGDGLTDMLYSKGIGSGGQFNQQVYILLNNGVGFNNRRLVRGDDNGTKSVLFVQPSEDDFTPVKHNNYLLVNDFNGDGLDDLLHYRRFRDDQNPPGYNDIHFNFYYSKGEIEFEEYPGQLYLDFTLKENTYQFLSGGKELLITNYSKREEDHGTRYYSKFYVSDFTNDGNLDFYVEDLDANADDRLISLIPGEHANHVKSITESFNNKWVLEYKGMDNRSVYSFGTSQQFPLIEFNSGMMLVAGVDYYKASDYSNPIHSKEFRYGHGVRHKDKGLLGFLEFEVGVSDNETSEVINLSYFSVDQVNQNGFGKKLFDLDIDSKLTHSRNLSTGVSRFIDRTDYSYFFELDQHTGVYNKYVASETIDQFDQKVTTTKTVVQDDYHNVLTQKTVITDQNTNNEISIHEITNTFDPLTLGSWDNLLKTSITSMKHYDDADYFKLKSIFTYNGTGNPYLPDSKTLTDLNHSDPNEDIGLIESYQYDGFGNTVSVTESISDPLHSYQPKPRYASYDGKGRYIVSETNAIGQSITREFTDIGMISKETDLDGNFKTYSYDGFGVLIETLDNFGYLLEANTGWVSDLPNAGDYPGEALIYVENTPAQGIPGVTVTNFMNALEQIIRVESDVLTKNGIKKVWTDKSYTNAAKISSESTPYFIADNPERITEYKYEAVLGQISEIKNRSYDNSESLVTSFQYDLSNRKVTTTDPSLNTTVEIVDAAGNQIESIDADNNSVHKKYASNGKVAQVETVLEDGINGEKISVVISYDNFGRKAKIVDPDAGEFSYKYNAYGELTEQSNKNGSFTYVYDLLGRKTQEKQFDNLNVLQNTIDYTYVGSGNGIGKVSSIADDVSTTVLSYYSNGKLLSSSETVEAYYDANNNQLVPQQVFTKSFTYDSYGRVKTETVESGHTFENVYHATHADLIDVKEKEAGGTYRQLWKFIDADHFGRLTEYQRGDALIENFFEFDDLGFPKEVKSHKVGNQQIYVLEEYVFDHKNGTLTSRSRNYTDTETFSYDNQYRLKSYTHNSVTNTMTYHKDGSIKSKTGIGNYFYNNTDNHKLTDLKNSSIVENGNTIILEDKTINYNAFNSIDDITQNNLMTDFRYRYDGQRIAKYAFDNGYLEKARYYSGAYEKELLANGDTKEIIYVPNTRGQVVIVKTTSGGNVDEKLYYPTMDYLGSLVALADHLGNRIESYSYDAWGRMRDYNNWNNYIDEGSLTYFDILGRGFTGHEHMSDYRLINMNGRVYDPILSQFIQPDNQVQVSDFTAGYNRYAYALNNPLTYTDPSGEGFVTAMLISAAISVASNGIMNSVDNKPFFQNAGYAAVLGAVGGAASNSIGAAVVKMKDASDLSKLVFKVVTHGHLGGVLSGLSGGKYGQGFVSSGIGTLAASQMGSALEEYGKVYQSLGILGVSPIASGVSSELMGGRFWIGFRNGLISAATNDMAHLGVNGLKALLNLSPFHASINITAAFKSGRLRHLIGPDAIVVAGYFDLIIGPYSFTFEQGIMILFVGENAGLYPVGDIAWVGMGIPSVGGGAEISYLYSTKSNPTKDDFTGFRYETGGSESFLGLEIGGNYVTSRHPGSSGPYTFGFATTIGADLVQTAWPGVQWNQGTTKIENWGGWKGTTFRELFYSW